MYTIHSLGFKPQAMDAEYGTENRFNEFFKSCMCNWRMRWVFLLVPMEFGKSVDLKWICLTSVRPIHPNTGGLV